MYEIDKSTRERIYILKVIFIIFVVYIHNYSEKINLQTGSFIFNTNYNFEAIKYILSNIVARVAVPSFFLFSGILLYSKPIKYEELIKKKIKTVLVPYFICNTIWILFFLIIQQIPYFSLFFTQEKNLIRNWEFLFWWEKYFIDPFLYPFWFIRNLFIVQLLCILLKKIIDLFPKITFIVLIIIWEFNFNFPECINQYIKINNQAFVFFLFGYYMIKYNITFEKLDRYRNKKMIIFYISLVILEYISFRNNVFIHNTAIILGVIVWIKISKFLISNNVLKRLKKYIFIIFAFHEFTLSSMKKIGVILFGQQKLYMYLEYFLLPIVVIYCCIILSKILEKYVPKFYRSMIGGRT